MRRLWADHVMWTRQYVVSAIADSADATAAADRLLKNQEDIGQAIVPFYGLDAGNALTGLLKQHILIAVDLIAAAKLGEQEKFKQKEQEWTRNAEEIATLLSGASPHWPKKDMVDLLALHLSLTKDEAVARLNKNWQADINAFDAIFTEINTLSDILSDGIIKQFPGKF